MKWSFGACLIATSFLLHPSVGSAQDKMTETPYFPLQVGNTWHYKTGDIKFTQKVIKIDTIDGVPCARLETLQADGRTIATEHLSVKDDGVYRVTLEGKRAEPPVLFLKLPPMKGVTWTIESKVGGKTVKCTFKSDEEEVKVPAGTYQAITVSTPDLEVNGQKAACTFYFAKDVGMVKQVIEVTGQKKVEIELEKFEPGKK